MIISLSIAFFWILSTGKRYITKVALEDCNLVEEFKAVTCENCRKVRKYVNLCGYHLLCGGFFLVLILALKKMIKMAKWSKVWVSKAWVSNCLDTIVALRDPDLVSRTVVIYVATVHWTVFIRILSHPSHGFLAEIRNCVEKHQVWNWLSITVLSLICCLTCSCFW